MKTVLCFVLLLVVLSNFTSGQLSPTNFNPNILVHSQGLPNEFLLFVPDTATQILFNPARANDYSGSFVYSTYAADFKRNTFLPTVYMYDPIYTYDLRLPPYQISIQLPPSSGNNETYGSGKNPTVAVATLFNALNSRWLFLFTNGIANQNGTSNYTSSNDSPDYYYQTNHSSSSSNSNSETKEGVTSFRLSNIFSSGTAKKSFGVFAVFNNALNNSTGNNANSSLTISGTTPLYYHSSFSNYTNKINADNSYYVLGLEFTAANEQWDYIARASYQSSTFDFKSTNSTNQQSVDSSYYGSSSNPVSSTSKSDRTNSYENFIKSEPYTLAFENYFQSKTTLLSLDGNIFLSANVNYTNGDGKVGGNSFSDNRNYYNGTWTTSGTISNFSEEKYDNKSWGFTFTPGFIIKKSFPDLFLLSGLKLETGYNKHHSTQTNYYYQSNYYAQGPMFLNSTLTLKFVTLALPIYINYSPVEWISIWGGMNYSYGYSKRVEDASGNSTSYYSSSSSTQTYSVNAKNDNSSYQSSKSTFLGLELKHSSGLRVQISFDEDVASFRDWNMSVGY
ncbi:MAG: hypothetical protein M0P61_16955, partial [Ignavibacteriaceae bacterium]|nr:hypothetical protein [Ignavibacteriaceae bacterium]